MDFETECSILESVDDNDISNVKTNGSFSDGDKLSSARNVGDVNVELGNSPRTRKKGYGLKKWRRIRRDVFKDGGAEVDSEKVLKRGLPGSASVNPVKSLQFMTEISEDSVKSVNVLTSVGVHDSFGVQGLSLDSGFAGAESENSEDRSSRSSTAASAPKAKFQSRVVIRVPKEKNRTKSLSGKITASQAQRNQQGKGQIESTKKSRGERVKIEKENSYSSIESDSRISNFLFMQGASSVNRNGKQNGRPMNYDGADSKKEHASGENTGHGEENMGEFEDISHNDLAAGLSWKRRGKGEKSENLQAEQEPLINSILSLQLVQEVLEKEVQKFGEVGNDLKSVLGHASNSDAASADFTSTKMEVHELSSSNESGSNIIRQNFPHSLQSKAVSLTEDVKVLESKLEDARNILEAKESRIAELEASLNLSRSLKEECGSTLDLQQEKYEEFETELESLFRQRVEAEVEYLAMIKTIQKMKMPAVDNNNVVKEMIYPAGEQELMADKLEEAKIKAEELVKCCEDIMGTEMVMEVQKKVCKTALCFCIELILLLLVVWLFVLQLKPHSGAFVPT